MRPLTASGFTDEALPAIEHPKVLHALEVAMGSGGMCMACLALSDLQALDLGTPFGGIAHGYNVQQLCKSDT